MKSECRRNLLALPTSPAAFLYIQLLFSYFRLLPHTSSRLVCPLLELESKVSAKHIFPSSRSCLWFDDTDNCYPLYLSIL